MPLVTLMAEGLLVVGLTVILLIVSPVATVLAVVGLGVNVLLLLRAIQPRMKQLGRESQSALRESLQTLQQALNRFRDIRLLGREAWLQAQLGVVSQSNFLIDDTIRNNVAFGRQLDEIDEEALRRAITWAQLDDVVASLPQGLDTPVGERGVRLSGGQRQRVAVARALYRD